MKVLLLTFVIAALQSDTTALVDASKDAKTKRKASTTKVITNADVKKSKGKVVVKPGTAPATEPKQEPTSLEKQATDRTARLAKEAKVAELQKTIARLEAEVAALEQSYYEANDLDYRDKVIVQRFNEAKQKLDAAKAELEAVTQSPGHPAPGDRETG